MSQYTDLYLRCNSKEEVAELLSLEEDQAFENYYENDEFIVDWIGPIPVEFDEEGNVTAWAEGLHFNVYAKPGYEEETNLLFNHFERAFPYTPFRKLAKEEMQVSVRTQPFTLSFEGIEFWEIEKIVGPFGQEPNLQIEVFYKFRREGNYETKEIREESKIFPYSIAPGVDVMPILERVKNGTATQQDYGIIDSILKQFNPDITVVG